MFTTVAIETRHTVALAGESIAARAIPANTRVRTVRAKRAFVARFFAAATFEPSCTRARASHAITNSTILARAFADAVTTVISLGAKTLAKDARVSVRARARSIRPVT